MQADKRGTENKNLPKMTSSRKISRTKKLAQAALGRWHELLAFHGVVDDA
jgi:hypothetical protein